MRTKLLGRLAGILVVALVSLSPGAAKATPVFQTFSCNQGIQYMTTDGSGLYVDCVGQPNRFVAFSFSPCSGIAGSIDNLKMFETMVTTAMLSGKALNITYATPASCVSGFGVMVVAQLQNF